MAHFRQLFLQLIIYFWTTQFVWDPTCHGEAEDGKISPSLDSGDYLPRNFKTQMCRLSEMSNLFVFLRRVLSQLQGSVARGVQLETFIGSSGLMFRAKEDRSGNRKSQNMLEMEIVSRFQSCSERNREIQDMLNLFETSNSLMHERKSNFISNKPPLK